MKNRLHLTILIFFSPLLMAASCNLGTFVAKNTIGRIFSAEDYEQGVDEILVHRLLIAPLATLTPTPSFNSGEQIGMGDASAQTGETGGTPSAGGNGGAGGNGENGSIDDTTHSTPTPTTTGQPTTTPTLLSTASATPIPSPTLLLTQTPTALPTVTATPVEATSTSTSQPTDEPANPAPSTATPTTTATGTATTTPTPTGLPALAASVKLSDPTGEIFPSGPSGNTPITYTIQVENTSAIIAANVTVRDSLSASFTLDNTTIYGPSPTVSGNTIVWGPFDVLPNTNKKMGFKGVWPYDPPSGVRGQLEVNTAEISATWLAAPIKRSASVFILYPPDIIFIAASLTPTTVIQTDSPAFEIDVANDGSADATITTASQLVLTNNSGIQFFTTGLSAATVVPADGQPYTLTFSPASLAAVPPGTYQADLYLSWQDENGVSDGTTFTDTGNVGVLAPAVITAAATPDPSTAVMGGSAFTARFWLWNTGDVPAQFHPGTDSIEIAGSTDWVNFFAVSSFNFPCGNSILWQGSNITVPPNIITRFTPSTICGDPFIWQPDPAMANAYYAYFDVGVMTPSTPGVYTITVRATFNGGTTVTKTDFPYVVP